jgi:hypothetical protein
MLGDLWETDLNVSERWVRIVAGTSAFVILGWVILAISQASIVVALGLPALAIGVAFVAWALAICFGLARRSWGLPIGRRLGGVWIHMQIWA